MFVLGVFDDYVGVYIYGIGVDFFVFYDLGLFELCFDFGDFGFVFVLLYLGFVIGGVFV